MVNASGIRSAAAIAAARLGAETLLIEKDGYLGGATVSQLVSHILSTNGVDFQGVWHEYACGLRQRGGFRELEGFGSGQIRGAVDPEMVKYVWDELLAAAGAEQLLHAWGANAIVEDGLCRGVLLETRAGRRAMPGFRRRSPASSSYCWWSRRSFATSSIRRSAASGSTCSRKIPTTTGPTG